MFQDGKNAESLNSREGLKRRIIDGGNHVRGGGIIVLDGSRSRDQLATTDWFSGAFESFYVLCWSTCL